MNCKIETTPDFARELKQLAKRYSSMKDDYRDFLDALRKSPLQGEPLGKHLRKVRFPIASKAKGKSGGALSLTLTNSAAGAPLGYRYADYTASNGATLTGSDADGWTLLMPDADVTLSVNTTAAPKSTGQAVAVSYVDATGTARETQAIALDGSETILREGTYYVAADITYTQTLTLGGDVTLILADAAALTAQNPTVPQYVTLAARTLYRDGAWNTLCLPFAVEDGDANDGVTFTGTPLQGAEVMTLGNSQACNTGFDAASIPEAYAAFDADALAADLDNHAVVSSDGYVQFIGTYSPAAIYTADKTNLYLGAANTLYYPWVDGMTEYYLNANRAYFQLKNGLTAGDPTLSRFVLNFGDGESSSIENGKLKIENEAGAWYTLDGRKLDDVGADPVPARLRKGLYIHNGRKVVIK